MSTDDNVAPWLLSSKVTPPRQLLTVIPRPAVVETLNAGLRGSQIALEAPAGYGKSTVLAEWRDHLLGRGLAVAWLAADEDDDAETFATYLAYACHSAGIDMSEAGVLRPDFHSDRATRVVLHTILGLLEDCGREIVLILDDLERLDPAVKRRIVDPILRRLPANVTVAAAARDHLGLDLNDLAHRGLVTAIGLEHLRFTREEVRRLAAGKLSRKHSDRVWALTEGWPVLVRLLLTAVDMGSLSPAQLAELDQVDAPLAEYFEQKILAPCGAEVRAFLCNASIFEEIYLDAAAHVYGAETVEAIAPRLAQMESFLTPIENELPGYRLHPLLRDSLERRLKLELPSAYRDYNERAAQWFAEHGNYVRALRHARKAGNEALVIRIVEDAGGILWWMREGLIRVRKIDGYLSDELVRQHPLLAFLRLIILIKDGRLVEAQNLFDIAESRCEQLELEVRRRDSGFRHRLILERELARGMLIAYRCARFEREYLDHFAEVAEAYAPDDGLINGFVQTCRCVAAIQLGNLDEAEDYGALAVRGYEMASSRYGAVFIDFHLAVVAMMQGEAGRAQRLLGHASQVYRAHFPFDEEIRLTLDVLQADLEHERWTAETPPEPKLRNMDERLREAEHWFEIYAAGYGSYAESLLRDGLVDEAVAMLEENRNFVAAKGVKRLPGYLLALQISLLVLAERSGEAQELFEASELARYENNPAATAYLSWREQEAVCEALGRLGAVRGTLPALEMLDLAVARAREHGIVRMLLRVLTLRAGVRFARGDQGGQGGGGGRNSEGGGDAAVADLREALGLFRRTGYRRSFLIGRKLLRPVAEHYLQRVPAEELSRAERSLLQAVARTAPAAERAADGPRLTARELTVLTELGKGGSDKHIARALGVTEHGIRYHLKNIYSKMRASNRTEAVTKARTIGIID